MMATISITPSSPASPLPSRFPTHQPPSPSDSNLPPKRLRSCLSPTRRLPSSSSSCGPTSPLGNEGSIGSSRGSCDTSMSGSMDEPSLTFSSSPMTSRSTSFSSQIEADIIGGEVERWRRSKSVRWDENEGCITPAYYSTWSADDYDRSPLDPPQPEERACLMPERGSRCLSPLNCFTDRQDTPPFFSNSTTTSPISIPSNPISFLLGTGTESGSPLAPGSGSSSLTLSSCSSMTTIAVSRNGFGRCDRIDPDEEAEDEGVADAGNTKNGVDNPAEADEDKEWEECMERRRMMFAQMSRMARQSVPKQESDAADSKDCERRFEGYTSLSATLLAMLAESGLDGGQARDTATPVGTPQEATLDEMMQGRRKRPAGLRRIVERRVSPMSLCHSRFEEDDDEDEDDRYDNEGEEEVLADDSDDGDDLPELEEEDTRGNQPSAETVFAALRAFRMGPGRELRTGAEERDTE